MVTALPSGETLHPAEKAAIAPVGSGPILPRIASAMDDIHSKQLFHGDIKPANILIPQREPVICEIVKLRSAVWRRSVLAYTAHRRPGMLFPAPNGISG